MHEVSSYMDLVSLYLEDVPAIKRDEVKYKDNRKPNVCRQQNMFTKRLVKES